jgi:hypothetical protein
MINVYVVLLFFVHYKLEHIMILEVNSEILNFLIFNCCHTDEDGSVPTVTVSAARAIAAASTAAGCANVSDFSPFFPLFQ